MNKEELLAYAANEEAFCRERIRCTPEGTSADTKLKSLYGVPDKQHTIYFESGRIHAAACLSPDSKLVVPVFPFKTRRDFEKVFGDMDRFIDVVQSEQKLIPIVQYPGYYVDKPHFDRFFKVLKPPSYFIRGQFAYAAIFDLPPNLYGKSDELSPLLAEFQSLIDYCSDAHLHQIESALKDPYCWEHRWRTLEARDEEFFNRLRRSLAYRYASVAICIGKDVADEIFAIFPVKESWLLLLHLHILFDHVIAHGFGSDYSVSVEDSLGRDFLLTGNAIKTTLRRALRPISLKIPKRLSVSLSKLLAEEHPLQGFRFEKLAPDNIDDIQANLIKKCNEYNKKMETYSQGVDIVSYGINLTLFMLAKSWYKKEPELNTIISILIGGDYAIRLKSAMVEKILTGLRRIHRRSLGAYFLETLH